MNSYLNVMRNYASFSGRMSRADYWQFVGVYVGIGVIAFLFDSMLGSTNQRGGFLVGLVAVAHLVPNLASLTRRLHDSNKSGWWLLLLLTLIGSIIPVIFTLLPGTPGPNQFGEPSDSTPLSDRSGSPPAAAGNQHRPATPASDPLAKLEKLAALKANGSLTDAEYEVMKARTLGRTT